MDIRFGFVCLFDSEFQKSRHLICCAHLEEGWAGNPVWGYLPAGKGSCLLLPSSLDLLEGKSRCLFGRQISVFILRG